jgi:hypothetical protein
VAAEGYGLATLQSSRKSQCGGEKKRRGLSTPPLHIKRRQPQAGPYGSDYLPFVSLTTVARDTESDTENAL